MLPTDHSGSNGVSDSRRLNPPRLLSPDGGRAPPPSLSERPRPDGGPDPRQSQPALLYLASDGSLWEQWSIRLRQGHTTTYSSQLQASWTTRSLSLTDNSRDKSPPFEIQESAQLLSNLLSRLALPHPYAPDRSFQEQRSTYFQTWKIHCI